LFKKYFAGGNIMESNKEKTREAAALKYTGK